MSPGENRRRRSRLLSPPPGLCLLRAAGLAGLGCKHPSLPARRCLDLSARCAAAGPAAGGREQAAQLLPAPSTATDSPQKNGEEGEAGREGAARSPGEEGEENLPASVLAGMESSPPFSQQPERCREQQEHPLPHGVGALPPLWGPFPPCDAPSRCAARLGDHSAPQAGERAKRHLPADAVSVGNANGVHKEPQPREPPGTGRTWTLAWVRVPRVLILHPAPLLPPNRPLPSQHNQPVPQRHLPVRSNDSSLQARA